MFVKINCKSNYLLFTNFYLRASVFFFINIMSFSFIHNIYYVLHFFFARYIWLTQKYRLSIVERYMAREKNIKPSLNNILYQWLNSALQIRRTLNCDCLTLFPQLFYVGIYLQTTRRTFWTIIRLHRFKRS